MKSKTLVAIRLGIIIMLNICLLLLYQAVTQAPIMTLSQQGSRGSQVRQIQERLVGHGFYKGKLDGVWGTDTTNAVKRFQRSQGIAEDGVAGVITLTGLGFTYQNGDKGEPVKLIQQKLTDLSYKLGTIDGIYAEQTTLAVRAFQEQNGLYSDGIVGFGTAQMLFSPNAKKNAIQAGYNDSDYNLLARIISAEARGEPYIGQVAVGAVVLNRVEHPSFPDTVTGVVYQKGAFTAITDGQIDQPISEASYRAAKEVLNGSDPSGGALYYFNPDKTDNKWMRTRPVIKRIGDHLFCS